MNILFDNLIFSSQPYGGISRYFYEIARRLAANHKHHVEIFAPLHINQYLLSPSDIIVTGAKINNIRFTHHAVRIINSVLSKILVSPRKDIDIYHETYFTLSDNCTRSAKRVITVHDMIHEKFPQYFSNRDTTARKKAISAKRADHIICVSENTRKDLIELLNVPEEKTSVVYHGYSLTCKSGCILPYRREKPFMLYVGNRHGHKNFSLLLRSFSLSPLLRKEVSIVCFGGGKPLKSELDLMNDLGLPTDCIDYIEGDDTVLARLYASANAFIYPSLYEGFGIPPLEAMSFRCPVICSNTSAMPEVVGDAAYLFNPQEEAELKDAMEKVIFSSDRSDQMISKGLDRVKMFSWDKCAEETLLAYYKAL